MVFRQLRIAWLAMLAFAGGACGSGSESSISVAMQLDGNSCGGGPNELILTCDSTAIVQVRDLDSDLISSDCVDLEGGRLTDMADVLGELVALGSLPAGTPLTIGLSIHSGTLESCPTTLPTGAFLFGNTMRVVLEELESDLILPLECIFDDGVPADSFCDECEISLGQCLQAGGLTSCDNLLFDCEQDCNNEGNEPGCFEACFKLPSFCFDGPQGISLSCFEQDNCALNCGDQEPVCIQACFDAQAKCSLYDAEITQCHAVHDQCLSSCSGADSCLGFGGFEPGV